MADSATTRLRLRKQSLGSNVNVWGDTYLNDSLDFIDFAIAGITSISFAGTSSGTSTTLTSTNYASDQSRAALLLLLGTSTTNQTITVPSVEKLYDVRNNLTITGSAYMKTAAGSATALPTGYSRIAVDGTTVTVLRATDYQGVALENVAVGTGSTYAAPMSSVITAAQDRSMGGYLISSLGTGTATHQAVNKGQMDTAIAAAGLPASLGAVLVSLNDTTPGYIGAKMGVGSSSLPLTIANPGANEILVVPLMEAATSTSSANPGVAPGAAAGDQNKFLRGDRTYAAAALTGNMITVSAGGTVSFAAATALSSSSALTAWGRYYYTGTASGTGTLPASPSTGDEIWFDDPLGKFGSQLLELSRNGNLIAGGTLNLVPEVAYCPFGLRFTGTSSGWGVI